MAPARTSDDSLPLSIRSSPFRTLRCSTVPGGCGSDTSRPFRCARSSYHSCSPADSTGLKMRRVQRPSALESVGTAWLGTTSMTPSGIWDGSTWSSRTPSAVVSRHTIANVGFVRSRSICDNMDLDTPERCANSSSVQCRASRRSCNLFPTRGGTLKGERPRECAGREFIALSPW